MKCPKCGSENPSDTRFCGQCASPLEPAEHSGTPPPETFLMPLLELKTGTLFAGRYQVIEELGRGGMGRVYKVLDKEVEEKVALKLIKPEIAFEEETIRRFRSELRLARQITHQNVCRMYDLGRFESTYYLAMEYVSGEDLKSTLKRMGPLSAGKVSPQVPEALSRIILKCLEKDRAARYPSAGELLSELEDSEAQLPGSAIDKRMGEALDEGRILLHLLG